MIRKYIDAFQSECYEITCGESLLVVNATRGGIPIRLSLSKKEVLYNDEEIYADLEKPIRGGIPILFPIAGGLRDGKYTIDGREYDMPKHGLIRNQAWTLLKEYADGASFVCHENAYAWKHYPREYALIHRYILKEDSLLIEQRIVNTGTKEIEFSTGLHPYFLVRSLADVKMDISATSYIDDLTGEEKPYTGVEFGEKELCYIIEDQSSDPTCNHMMASLGDYDLELRYSKEYKYLVLWAIGKKFVCIEPWTAKPDALNTKVDTITLAEGEKHSMWVEIKIKHMA